MLILITFVLQMTGLYELGRIAAKEPDSHKLHTKNLIIYYL